MKKSMLLLAAMAAFGFNQTYAQNNLVSNGNFSNVEKKVKTGEGEIMLATGWFSTSETNQADLYQAGNKKGYGIPENDRGMSDAYDGDVYAGIRAYSPRGRESLTFIQTKLEKPLIAGKVYCVTFQVSLSDLSKYATNSIGAYFSEKKVKDKDIETYTIRPQVMLQGNPILNDMYLWQTVCATFKADGNERYMTIGNFRDPSSMSDSDTERMKKPRSFSEMQTQDGYYFVDDVRVVSMEEIAVCECATGDEDQLQVVYTQNTSSLGDMAPADQLKSSELHFETNATTPNSSNELDEIAQLISDNAELTVVIVGHTDGNEEANNLGNLSLERAEAVKNYLVEKGVDGSRLSTRGARDAEPVDDMGTREAMAKNRRVSFEVE